METHKCIFPGCTQDGTMLANLRVISKDYKPLKNKIAQLTTCPYHFCVLQNDQFNWVKETNELYGPLNTVSLIECVLAGKMVAEARRKSNDKQ